MEIVFAKTRYWYDSYTDYRKLVELAGFETCYVDEMDLSNPELIYIVSPKNGELVPHLENHEDEKEAQIFWHNLERPGGSGSIQEYADDGWELVDRGLIDAVIVSDKHLAKETGFHYVPVGGHPEFGGLGDSRIYDIVHMTCYSYRRSPLYYGPGKEREEVYGVRAAPNGWGEAKHNLQLSSKFMLNIHQDADPFIEPLRFVAAACYGLPIITEMVIDAFPYREWKDYIQASLDDLEHITKKAVEEYALSDVWRNRGRELRERMTTEFDFRTCWETFL